MQSKPRRVNITYESFADYIKKPSAEVLQYAQNDSQRKALDKLYRNSNLLNKYYKQVFSKNIKLDRKPNFERDIIYFKILELLEPRLYYVRKILKACTRESIVANKDKLIDYFIRFDESVSTGANNEPIMLYSINVALWAYYRLADDSQAYDVFPITRDFENGRVSDIAVHFKPYTSIDVVSQFMKHNQKYIQQATSEQLRNEKTKRKKTSDRNVLQNATIRFLIANDFSNKALVGLSDEIFYSKEPLFPAGRKIFNTDDCNNYRAKFKKQLERDWFHYARIDYLEYKKNPQTPPLDLRFDNGSHMFYLEVHL